MRFIPATNILQVSDRAPPDEVDTVVFDHDGTISTLREGWEQLMEPLAMREIRGDMAIDFEQQEEIRQAVRAMIDETTGMQTLRQMERIGDLVAEFGYNPVRRTAAEYKAIYNQDLLRMVNERLALLDAGFLDRTDFTLKSACKFVHELHSGRRRLYLASGTDVEDVKREAAVLGYAPWFGDNIYGSVGNIRIEAKEMILDRIFEFVAADKRTGIVVIGDGPVEIREGRKRGAFTIGVASDEIRRHGWNERKKDRLVKAGADILIPDYSQLHALLAFLHVENTFVE